MTLREKDIGIDRLVDTCSSISQIRDALMALFQPDRPGQFTGSSRRHDVRTHLASRAGYSIHRACFLLVRKKNESRRTSLFPVYLHEGNSLISTLLFPEGIYRYLGDRNPSLVVCRLLKLTCLFGTSGPALPLSVSSALVLNVFVDS